MLSTHSTLALLSEGCAFILRRYRPRRSDVFENRIMLARAVRTATTPSPLEPGAAHECILEALTMPRAVSGSNEMPVDLSDGGASRVRLSAFFGRGPGQPKGC
jgi:hypothetical protein